MAKVKTAKQKLEIFFKAKGLDASEIREAFAELDEADVDLENLAAQITDVTTKNQQWMTWYQGALPEFQNAIKERDALKAKLAKLAEAGFSTEEMTQESETTAEKLNRGQFVTPEELTNFKKELASATSTVMKQLTRVGLRHMKDFDEEADLDAIEKLVAEKGYSVEDAYDKWVQPKRDARLKEDTQKQIAKGIQEGIAAELSRQGIRGTRKKPNEIQQEPLDKLVKKGKEEVPTDSELRAEFLAGLDEGATN